MNLSSTPPDSYHRFVSTQCIYRQSEYLSGKHLYHHSEILRSHLGSASTKEYLIFTE
nr:MAG TPA: hypothetical protein [Caudoviricetes sp.]